MRGQTPPLVMDFGPWPSCELEESRLNALEKKDPVPDFGCCGTYGFSTASFGRPAGLWPLLAGVCWGGGAVGVPTGSLARTA